jgi:acetolactate synthase-1/2/3 large subunit
MKLSDFVADYLLGQGIDHGYFMIGGAIGHLADSCSRKGFRLYTLHHEQSAAFAAEGQAAATRNAGVAMATSGPGATNLVTGIGSAYFSSQPVLFITGQVNTFESNLDGKRRQVGFQETDIVTIVKSITKYAKQVTKPETICYELEKALFIAKSGRMGPVLLDIPFDIQKAEINPEAQPRFIGSKEHAEMSKKSAVSKEKMAKIATLISSSKRPIVLLGHGVKLSGAEEKVRKFVEKANIPVVASLMGTDIIENSHQLYLGFIGTYGDRHANLAVANSDLVLVLGARLDSRQVGVQAAKFAPAAKIVHVDIDPSELGAAVKEEESILSDVGNFLDALLPLMPGAIPDRKEWRSFLMALKAKYADVHQEISSGISPKAAIAALCNVSKEGDTISVDVGSHQMWFAQAWKTKKGQLVLTNGGMGPMGCSVPTAIGVCTSTGMRPVFVVVGDGSFQVNIQELQAIVRHKIPVRIMVINNHSLGMLTQFQSENFEGRLIGSVEGYDAPDFVKVALAYGVPAQRAEKNEELSAKVKWLASQKGPAVLEVCVPQTFWVLPKSSYAKPVHDMKPYLSEKELKEALKYI